MVDMMRSLAKSTGGIACATHSRSRWLAAGEIGSEWELPTPRRNGHLVSELPYRTRYGRLSVA